MELLKLLLVDDERIILQGLLQTYDWEDMGYQVVGAAQSGEAALALIEDEEPDVVITDVRMKKISGLDLIEQTRRTRPGIKFVVVSAYKDFEYARKACEEGALAYLVKPVEDDKLEAVMKKAYDSCMSERKKEQEYESLKKVLSQDSKNFLSQMVGRYIKDALSENEFKLLSSGISGDSGGVNKYYSSICVDIDAAYKVTNQVEFDARRYMLFQDMEQRIESKFKVWVYQENDGSRVFLVRLGDLSDIDSLKALVESVKAEYKEDIVSAISNAYMGLGGLKIAYNQGMKLYEIACEAGAGLLTVQKDAQIPVNARYFEDIENQVIRVMRKNSREQLREVFEAVVYHLPSDERTARAYLHRLAVRVEVMLDDSYGVSENIRMGFANFYGMINEYTLPKLVDILYKLMGAVTEERLLVAPAMAEEYFSGYMESALQYVREHLDEEELSITSVADEVFLNPVYFGRLFKNVMGMTFKKYVLNERMERAKKFILESSKGIAEIGGMVGIPNPSYFSQLFKQATGKLPSEYKKEYNA